MKENVIVNNINPQIGVSTLLTHGDDEFIHSHPYYEIFYVTYGNITHSLNFVKRELSVGDLVILKPEDVHYFLRNNSDASHRDIMIQSDLFVDICNLIPNALSIINNNNTSFKLSLSNLELAFLEEKINDFVNNTDITVKKVIGVTVITEILKIFLERINKTGENANAQKPNLLLQNLLEVFNRTDSLTKPISEIISFCGYTQSYMCRFFKKETGFTLTEYFNNVKLQHAVYYLENTNLSIRAICNVIGINSTAYFNKLFKKTFNLTPTQFIASKRKNR